MTFQLSIKGGNEMNYRIEQKEGFNNKRVMVGLWLKFRYFFIWVSIITLLFDIVIERYTDLLEYGLLTWYWMWIYIGFLFYVSQACCNWFIKYEALFQTEDWGKPNEN